MNFEEYRIAAQRTSNTAARHEKILNGAMGLAGEAGEVIDLVKKYMFQGHDIDLDKLIDEAGDCLWYLAELSVGLGVSLEDIAMRNVEKLWRRFPQGFDSVRSVNRGDDE